MSVLNSTKFNIMAITRLQLLTAPATTPQKRSFVAGDVIDLDAPLNFTGLSADPDDPVDGEAVLWISDGTDSGDAGDVMMKINVGDTVKTATVVDFSAVS